MKVLKAIQARDKLRRRKPPSRDTESVRRHRHSNILRSRRLLQIDPQQINQQTGSRLGAHPRCWKLQKTRQSYSLFEMSGMSPPKGEICTTTTVDASMTPTTCYQPQKN
eukprot:Lithocolla_globosa_v1_NODE_136_length_5835_cov_11.826644.p9 type:complete len:109 gc:universal NODE_136_length_5835_cov_11.826644:3912-4238(+)